MSSEKPKKGLARYLNLIGVGAIIAAVFNIAFVYYYHVPDLKYQKFRPYKLSDEAQVSLIVVSNEGHDVAKEVRVRIEAVGEIVDCRFEGVEEITLAREGKDKVVLTSDRLVEEGHIEIFIITAGKAADPIRSITVTCDQGNGHEKTFTPEPTNPWSTVGGVFVGAFFTYLYMKDKYEKNVDRLAEKLAKGMAKVEK